MVLFGNIQVIATLLHLDSQPTESVRDDTQILERNILDSNFTTGHSSHTNKTTHFNHIRKHCMSTTAQTFHTFNGQQVRSDTRDTRSHGIQHLAQLLQIRFTSSIIDCCLTFRQHGRHNDIGRTGY